MEEIWKDVIDYQGIYQVSNLGRIKGLPREILKNGKYPFICKEKIIKLCLNTSGYYYVGLSENSLTISRTIHQLVAEAFLGHKPCGMKLIIDHINDVKTDNRVENLQIVTNRYNVCKNQGKHTSKYKGVSWCKVKKKWVVRFKLNDKYLHLGYFDNEEEASEIYNNKLKQI